MIDREEERAILDEALLAALPKENGLWDPLIQAMRYSLEAGGKRVRPMLVLEFCRACGGEIHAALPFACAVEMIHTYSLIHDDLPCMDDDDLRRGRPSSHKKFGEAMALLAGDALLTLAFEIMLSPESMLAAGEQRASRAALTLASCAGAAGMVGGQALDLTSEGTPIPLKTLEMMDACKTGALITASCRMGCIVAGAGAQELSAAGAYASAVGLAFQIVDDILDVTSTTGKLGKPVGSDADNKKSTYVSLMGLEQARREVQRLTQRAVDALAVFGERGAYLADFARQLARRME